jgi:hypothetical protein
MPMLQVIGCLRGWRRSVAGNAAPCLSFGAKCLSKPAKMLTARIRMTTEPDRVATVGILARHDVRPGWNPQDTFLGATGPVAGRLMYVPAGR